MRDSLERLRNLPLVTPTGATVPLSQVADVKITDGPAMLQSENARLIGVTFVDIQGRDIGSFIAEARKAVAEQVVLPAGYSLRWSGQYEYMNRALAKLQIVTPVTLAIIFLLLYLSFGRLGEAVLIMATLPFALLGGIWLLYWLDYNLSVAVGVGFIALAGIIVRNSILLVDFIRNGAEAGEPLRETLLRAGAIRFKPILLTAIAAMIGASVILTDPIFQGLAISLLFGLVSSTLLTVLVIPAIYVLFKDANAPYVPAAKNGDD